MPGAMRRPDDAAARVAPTPTPTPAATPSPATRANPIARRFIPSKVPHQPSLIEKRRFRRSLEIPAAAAATARPPASREPSESSPDALRKSTSSGESVGRADAAAPTDCGGGSTTKRLLGALAGTLRRSSSPRAATLRPEPTRRSGRSCHSAFPGLLQWERGSRDGLQQPEVAASKASLNGLRTCKSWYAGYGTLREDEDHTTLNEQPSWAADSGLAAPQRIEGGDAGGAEGAGGGAPWAASPAPRRRAALDALLGTLAGRRAASRDSALAAAAPAPLRAAATSASAAALGELPLRPVNRLRSPPGVCSRCSSLLSLAGATGSRYSLDALAGGFVAVAEEPPALAASVVCKLCLEDTAADAATAISMCGCAFCTKCMQSYAEFEITNGAYELSCPDASCRIGGALTLDEIGTLVGSEMLERHKRYKLNHEVVMDASRAWCPRAGCETVCRVAPGSTAAAAATPGPARATQRRRIALPVHCPTCELHFCSDCNQEWHEGLNCEESAARRGGSDTPAAAMLAAAGLPPDSDLIKWCPMCRVPIEKDEGCAQMMCKRCKHVFCWYCLASLDDDFLLRHYDKGPCKNKLGHSRASVIWHRAQVVGIFAGFGLLLLAASPLLLLAAPCIVCCKCRLCGARSRQPLGEDEPVQLDRERPEAD